MPQKRKTRSRSKKKTSGKKGTRKISGANGAIEASSGSESSSLVLKRKAISVPDEYRVPVTSGQLSGDAQGFPTRTSMRHRPTDCRLQAAGEGVKQLDNKLVVWRTSNMEIQQAKDSRYVKNAGAVFNLYHIVFCPKCCRKVLVGDVETRRMACSSRLWK